MDCLSSPVRLDIALIPFEPSGDSNSSRLACFLFTILASCQEHLLESCPRFTFPVLHRRPLIPTRTCGSMNSLVLRVLSLLIPTAPDLSILLSYSTLRIPTLPMPMPMPKKLSFLLNPLQHSPFHPASQSCNLHRTVHGARRTPSHLTRKSRFHKRHGTG